MVRKLCGRLQGDSVSLPLALDYEVSPITRPTKLTAVSDSAGALCLRYCWKSAVVARRPVGSQPAARLAVKMPAAGLTQLVAIPLFIARALFPGRSWQAAVVARRPIPCHLLMWRPGWIVAVVDPCDRDAPGCANFVRTSSRGCWSVQWLVALHVLLCPCRHDLVNTENCGTTCFRLSWVEPELCVHPFSGAPVGLGEPESRRARDWFKIVLPSKNPCVSCTHWEWCRSAYYGAPNPCMGLGFGPGWQPHVLLEVVCVASRCWSALGRRSLTVMSPKDSALRM